MYDFCFEIQELIQSKYPKLSFDEIHDLKLGNIWQYIKSLSSREKRY